MFIPPQDFVVFESLHWRINQRVDAKLPGYLMMAPKDLNAVSFSAIAAEALIEMGPLLAKVTKAIEKHLHPLHLYVARYGHMGGHNLHFHIIPVYGWVAEAFRNDPRYHALQQFYTPGVYTSGKDTGFDGAEMTLFIWREFAESLKPPQIRGPTIQEIVTLLRRILNKR